METITGQDIIDFTTAQPNRTSQDRANTRRRIVEFLETRQTDSEAAEKLKQALLELFK